MFFRILFVFALAIGLSACAARDKTEVSDIRMEERQDITTGPLYGTEIYDQTGPRPGTQQDLVVNVGDRIFYGFDRYDLDAEARQALELQAEWLKRHPNVNVIIAGHCDERGTREYNLALGERRANSAKQYLVALGIDARRINTISYGKERPAVLGSNASAWAQNRRAVTEVN